MKFGISMLLAASAVGLVVSCSFAGTEPVPPTPPVVTTEADPAYPPLPTVAELNEALRRGFDPAVPIDEKAAFVQGAEEDQGLIDQVVAAAVANSASVEITSVDDLGDGSLNAGATLSIGGQPNPGTMIFVAEDGVWKLSRDNACAFVDLAGLTTPACPV
ncbi:hypothetical protein QMK17_00655 [Rhodococcus sp. G-MC3]|uniref:hypothetical protein n=1 Tax=Rhodococcus sp. G-MC3 TaxID=3046209 RepID=UPI0024B9F276|nr:hypothetical protein [Rhodococcus sp. G-MC3]MDJ0391839.1 hypothetical protein [Rhodococcus sp. G-MC3]